MHSKCLNGLMCHSMRCDCGCSSRRRCQMSEGAAARRVIDQEAAAGLSTSQGVRVQDDGATPSRRRAARRRAPAQLRHGATDYHRPGLTSIRRSRTTRADWAWGMVWVDEPCPSSRETSRTKATRHQARQARASPRFLIDQWRSSTGGRRGPALRRARLAFQTTSREAGGGRDGRAGASGAAARGRDWCGAGAGRSVRRQEAAAEAKCARRRRAVVRGTTPQLDLVAGEASRGLADESTEYEIRSGSVVTTERWNGEARAGRARVHKGWDAAVAAQRWKTCANGIGDCDEGLDAGAPAPAGAVCVGNALRKGSRAGRVAGWGRPRISEGAASRARSSVVWRASRRSARELAEVTTTARMERIGAVERCVSASPRGGSRSRDRREVVNQAP